MTLFEGLNRNEFGQNAAALPGLQILPCSHVKLWPGSRLGKMSGAILVNTNLQWARLYLTDQTAAFSEKMSLTDHGRKYSFQVGGFYPGDSEDLRRFLSLAEWIPFIVRVTDTHGLTRIIGTDKFGLELDFDSMIAAEMAGRRGTTMTFSGELPVGSALEY